MNTIKKLQLISFLGGMTFYTAIFTLFLLERNITLSSIVALNTAFSVALMVSVIPTGIFADKYGQKLAIQVGLILDAVSMLGLLFVNGIAGLLLFFTVRGLSVSFRDGSDDALLYESHIDIYKSPEGYSKAYGKMMANDILGFVVATALSGIAFQFFGRAAYVPIIIATSFATIAALIVASTIKNKIPVNIPEEKIDTLKEIKQGLRMILSKRPIFALTLISLLTLSGEYFLRQTYQPFFQEMAVPAVFLGVALSLGKLLNFVAIRNSARLEKYFTVDQILFGLNASLGILFIIFAWVESPFALIFIFIAIQSLFSTGEPIISDYVNQEITSEKRSTVLSSISFVRNFGEIIARVLLSISIGLIGLSSTFALQGIYLVIGASIGVWYLIRCGCIHKIRKPALA